MLRLKTRLATDQNERRLNDDDQGNCNEICAVAVRLGWCPPGFGIPHLDSTKLPGFSDQFLIIINRSSSSSSRSQQHITLWRCEQDLHRWKFPGRHDPLPLQMRPGSVHPTGLICTKQCSAHIWWYCTVTHCILFILYHCIQYVLNVHWLYWALSIGQQWSGEEQHMYVGYSREISIEEFG